MNTQNTLRNATLDDLATMLREQHARKLDIVAPASAITARDGKLVIRGAEAELTEDGVTVTDGTYLPTAIADEGIASKLGIPQTYLRRMRDGRTDLYDTNVNGWLHGRRPMFSRPPVQGEDLEHLVKRPAIPGDDRSFLVRCFRGDDNESGIARAFLSDSYKVIDNLDVLMATLEGVHAAGVNVEVDRCDLTDRRMYVRVTAPEVQALAPQLLAGYRSPFNGQTGDQLPVVFAGFVFQNSEVGSGAFSVKPQIIVKVCSNGMTVTKDVLRSVHLGGKLEEGIVNWSDDTQAKNLQLVTAKTRDAIATFLDVDYVTKVVAGLEERATRELVDAPEVIRTVSKKLAYNDDQAAGILAMFVRGGQMTTGGVMQALTAYAQTVDDADVAAGMEDDAIRALDLAVALS
jgi:hypothetical protein